MTRDNAIAVLSKRAKKLEQIANSDLPMNPQYEEIHRKRVKVATLYLAELNSLIDELPLIATNEVAIVPRNVFEKRLLSADYAFIDDEGFFFSLASVHNFEKEDSTLLYLVPLYNFVESLLGDGG